MASEATLCRGPGPREAPGKETAALSAGRQSRDRPWALGSQAEAPLPRAHLSLQLRAVPAGDTRRGGSSWEHTRSRTGAHRRPRVIPGHRVDTTPMLTSPGALRPAVGSYDGRHTGDTEPLGKKAVSPCAPAWRGLDSASAQ